VKKKKGNKESVKESLCFLSLSPLFPIVIVFTSLLKQNLISTKCVWAIVCLKSNAISKKVFKTILNDIMGVDILALQIIRE
jgi:hypothetical protein